MTVEHDILVTPDGRLRFVYSDIIAQTVYPIASGVPVVRRASHVEPDGSGRWTVDLSPSGGPILGPFVLRDDALEAERDWLNKELMGGR